MKLVFNAINLAESNLIKIFSSGILIQEFVISAMTEFQFIEVKQHINNITINMLKIPDLSCDISYAKPYLGDVSVYKGLYEMKTIKSDGEQLKYVKLMDYVGVSDVLNFHQAYETVITGIPEDADEVYFVFDGIKELFGTAVKAIALKQSTGVISSHGLTQCYKRIVNEKQIVERFELRRKQFIKRYVLFSLTCFIVGLIISYFIDYKWIIIIFLTAWIIFTFVFHDAYEPVKNGYTVLLKNEAVFADEAKVKFSLEDEVEEIDFDWEKAKDSISKEWIEKYTPKSKH